MTSTRTLRWFVAGLMATGAALASASTSRPPAPETTNPRAGSVPASKNAEPTPAKSTPLDLGPTVIRQAVKDSIDPADTAADAAPRTLFGSGQPTRQQRIDRAFAEAQIPTCMTMDAWKFAPPMIGPIPIPGIFAAPFLVRNIVTGKCRH